MINPPHHHNVTITKILLIVLILMTPLLSKAQQGLSFGLHADPVISWFSSDINEISNDGARAGFNFGLSVNKYFGPNYSFSTGINLISAGGRTVSTDTTNMKLGKQELINAAVMPGNSITYKIQYVSIPLGLKLQTNQIGFVTFFSDIGFDPKVVVNGKVDVPSLDISNEKAQGELRVFNLSYHITAGIEYSMGGTTAIVAGLGFDNNFLDITKDRGDKISDKISHKLLSFRIGINF